MKMIWLASLYKLRNQKIREDIWLSPKTKALYQQKSQLGKVRTQKTPPKIDYKTIAYRLRTVSWSNSSHPTGVVNRFTGPTFPLSVTAV